MVGKIVGVRCFTSKEKEKDGVKIPPRDWVSLWLKTDMEEGGVGDCVKELLCTPDKLPKGISAKELIGHSFVISTRNNFASEFYCVDK